MLISERNKLNCDALMGSAEKRRKKKFSRQKESFLDRKNSK
jgi:hypothetical protein